MKTNNSSILCTTTNKQNLGFLLIIISCIFLSCSNHKTKENSDILRPVKTGTVKTAAKTHSIKISGTVSSTAEAYPAFSGAGIIKNLFIQEGEFIEKGSLIAELDDRDAKEAFAASKAKYDQVSSEVERVVELYNKGSVAKNEYEKAISGLQTVKSLFETSKNKLNDTKLIAPISGIVQEIFLGNGQMATPMSPIINIVGDENLILEGFISSSTFLNHKNIINCYATSSIIEDSIPLSILFLSPKANNNQLHKIRFSIPSKYKDILSLGMVLSINITLKTNATENFIITFSSCFILDNKSYVWVVDTVSNTIKKQRIITEGIDKDGYIKIIYGLKGDEMIVTAGVNMLNENDKIKILKGSSKTITAH